MEFLNEFLPILLYIAGIVALVVLIILGIKAIRILDQVEDVVDDVQEKIDSFDGAISVLSKTANSVAGISSTIVNGFSSIVTRIFSKKDKEENFYE